MSLAQNANRPTVAIVAGASSRYGTDVAHALAADHRVLLVDAHGVSQLADAIKAKGGDVESLRIEMSDPESLASIGPFAEEHLGPPSIYVHCVSSSSGPESWLETPVDVCDRTFAEKVRSVWLACRSVVPTMRADPPAKIIVVGADGAASGLASVHQATAMSALIGVVRSLAREVGDDNIAVNMICASDELGQKPEVAALLGGSVAGIDVAQAVMFLAGADAEFITGQSWLLNGGSWMQ